MQSSERTPAVFIQTDYPIPHGFVCSQVKGTTAKASDAKMYIIASSISGYPCQYGNDFWKAHYKPVICNIEKLGTTYNLLTRVLATVTPSGKLKRATSEVFLEYGVAEELKNKLILIDGVFFNGIFYGVHHEIIAI